MWTSDNSSTAASFFLVYNPGRRPTYCMGNPLTDQLMHQQIGAMDAGGSVMRAATPMANNVNLLVNSVILNYMALHGEQGQFANLLMDSNGNPWNHGLGIGNQLDTYDRVYANRGRDHSQSHLDTSQLLHHSLRIGQSLPYDWPFLLHNPKP